MVGWDPKASRWAPSQENGAPETGGGAPDDPDGAPENHRHQDASASEDSIAGEGDGSRQDEVSPAQEEAGSESKGGTPAETDDGHPLQPRGRKRRVKVTPNDWEKLEEVSEHLGVGNAKVYRIAFQKLCRGLEI